MSFARPPAGRLGGFNGKGNFPFAFQALRQCDRVLGRYLNLV